MFVQPDNWLLLPLLVSCSKAPVQTEMLDVLPKAPPGPRANVPCETQVAPQQLLELESVSVPGPVFCSDPLPLIGPLKADRRPHCRSGRGRWR